MSPLQSNLAIRVRNKIGNICPECRDEICKTKRGRWKMFFYDLKVGFLCFWFLVYGDKYCCSGKRDYSC